MAAKDKDTIYIDVDDEITGIIDKLKGSEGKIVALVLPKRASVFQSIVNMKLLKRAADSSKKNLVLITAEAGLLPLAGAAGIHVAKTLTSKPEIPSAPSPSDTEETVPEPPIEEADEPVDKTKPIGQLATGATAADGIETLKLPDEDLADAAKPGSKTFEPPKKKKNKKLKIPDFNRFRLWLILGGAALVLLIIILIFITVALPKATISIGTDATNVNTNLNLSLSTTAKSLDPVNNVLPSKLAQEQKTYTQQVATTGQKNNGNKATGSVNMSGQTCGNIPNGNPATVPAGTGLSANGQTYITQEDTAFSYSGAPHNGCLNFQANDSTHITAQSGGANFNVSGVSFTVSGRGDVSASGSASGGTDNIVQTVNQNDINNAKGKITPDDSKLKQDLQSQLKGQKLYPILATYNAGTPNVTTSSSVGMEASSVTVTEVITYQMFGVQQKDLTTLIDNQVNTQIDTSKQSVLDTGLSSGVFNVSSLSATGGQLNLSTNATAGPHLDINAIKKQMAGKKAGYIKSQLGDNPDVTSVKVDFSPFWVSTAPKKTSRITVKIAKPKTTVKASNSSANQH